MADDLGLHYNHEGFIAELPDILDPSKIGSDSESLSGPDAVAGMRSSVATVDA